MKSTNALAKEGRINENANIRDQHSIIINASIEKVWDVIVNIEDWPNWNADISKVTTEGLVSEGTKFKWIHNGSKTHSQIQRYKKPHELAWSSKSNWVKSITTWQLESDEGQTIITISTSLQGFLIINSHLKVYDVLIRWLERLKEKAEAD